MKKAHVLLLALVLFTIVFPVHARAQDIGLYFEGRVQPHLFEAEELAMVDVDGNTVLKFDITVSQTAPNVFVQKWSYQGKAYGERKFTYNADGSYRVDEKAGTFSITKRLSQDAVEYAYTLPGKTAKYTIRVVKRDGRGLPLITEMPGDGFLVRSTAERDAKGTLVAETRETLEGNVLIRKVKFFYNPAGRLYKIQVFIYNK